MSVISLISDWQNDDYYISAVKGSILSRINDVTIVDISHKINRFSTSHAAFIIRNTYNNFPKGTIHLICVNSEYSNKTPHLIVKANDHYFIGADNGVFGFILDNSFDEVVILPKVENSTFPEIDVFVEAAVSLINGKKMLDLGEKFDDLSRSYQLQATIDNSVINGSVIFIDSYKNLITNITKVDFENVAKGRDFNIFVSSNHYVIKHINNSYNQSPGGELLALFNSAGLLEIAICNGAVAELLNVRMNATIRVKFLEKNTENIIFK